MKMDCTLRAYIANDENGEPQLYLQAVSPDGTVLQDWGPWPATEGTAVCVQPACLECVLSTTVGPCDELFRSKPAPKEEEKPKPAPTSGPHRPGRPR